MRQIIKDNINILYLCLSIILLGSISLSIVTPTEEETIIETEIYTTDDYVEMQMFNTYQNRVDQIESKILSNRALIDTIIKNQNEIARYLKLPKKEPIIEVIEQNDDGSSTLTWPPRFRLNFKSPTSENK